MLECCYGMCKIWEEFGDQESILQIQYWVWICLTCANKSLVKQAPDPWAYGNPGSNMTLCQYIYFSNMNAQKTLKNSFELAGT